MGLSSWIRNVKYCNILVYAFERQRKEDITRSLKKKKMLNFHFFIIPLGLIVS